MKETDFSRYVTAFFTSYLPGQRNLSTNTIKSYRDTIHLFLIYCRDEKKLSAENLQLKQINKTLISDFLLWLEIFRHNSASTRNQRLASIHALFTYIQYEAPEHLLLCQQVLGVPFKRAPKPTINSLTHDQMKLLLEKPDTSGQNGRRDLLLLSLLYDTGGRVQEIADLTVRDIRLESPATIMLQGKGNKTRFVPLTGNTGALLKKYMEANRLIERDKHDHPLFFNKQQNKLTRGGITYILNKYVSMAKVESTDFPEKVTPHVLRHTKAMHLLESGVNLIYIRDLLGHASITTTEIYAKANTEMKRAALENAYPSLVKENHDSWEDNPTLITWLQRLCN